MKDQGFRKADELISMLFEGVNKDDFNNSIQLANGWKSIVGSISTSKEEGNKTGMLLVSHSKIIDLKNGILLIETDHSAYIQMFQMYRNYILRGLNKKFPSLEIKVLSFRLKGTDHKIYDAEENTKKEENLKDEEKIEGELKVKDDLPDELKHRFEALRKSILTKD